MAEARAAAADIRVVGSLQLEAIAHRAKLRGPQAHGCHGGLVVVIPSPENLFKLVLYKSYHVYNHFQRACWPAPVWAVMLTLTVCISHVMISTDESWYRSGPVATWFVCVFLFFLASECEAGAKRVRTVCAHVSKRLPFSVMRAWLH